MTNEERAVVIDVLCGQAMADHLGDVRDEERKLWELLGIDTSYDEEAPDVPIERAVYRLNKASLPLPAWLDE